MLAVGERLRPRLVASPRFSSSVVNGWGSPPTAGTRERPLVGSLVNTMVSSASQVAPRLRETLHTASGAPPVTWTLRSSLGSA